MKKILLLCFLLLSCSNNSNLIEKTIYIGLCSDNEIKETKKCRRVFVSDKEIISVDENTKFLDLDGNEILIDNLGYDENVKATYDTSTKIITSIQLITDDKNDYIYSVTTPYFGVDGTSLIANFPNDQGTPTLIQNNYDMELLDDSLILFKYKKYYSKSDEQIQIVSSEGQSMFVDPLPFETTWRII